MGSIPKKPRLAWFSPLDGIAKLGSQSPRPISAYCTELLLPYLKESFEIELFHDSFRKHSDYPTHHYISAFLRHKQNPFDIFFYQLEDGMQSNFIRQFLGVMPGVVWFHDFLFTTHGPEPILNSPWEEVVQKYQSSTYPWPERGTEFPERERTGVREATLSYLSLYSTEIGYSESSRCVERRLTNESHHSYFLPLPLPAETAPAIGKERRILFSGSPRIEHRAHKVLQALSMIENAPQFVWLLNENEKESAENLLTEFGISSAQLVMGRSPEKWQNLICSKDIAVHTHFSVYGQLGPYLGISLRAGLPTLVTDFAFAEFLPDELVFKVRPGDSEASELSSLLKCICTDSVEVPVKEATRYARESFDASLVAEELKFALLQNLATLQSLRARWEELEHNAQRNVVEFLRSETKTDDAQSLFGADLYQDSITAAMKDLRWS